jgi:hypothetical protein
MWECEECGCLAIAAGLTVCPMCGKPQPAPVGVPTPAGEETSAEESGSGISAAVPGSSSQASPKNAGKGGW